MKNIGNTERAIRFILAILFFILSFTIYNYWGILFFVLGMILFATSIIGFCPIYSVFHYSSKGRLVDKISKSDIKKAVNLELSKDISTQLEMIKPEKIKPNKKNIKKTKSIKKKATTKK